MANTFILPRGVSTIPQSRIDYNAAITSLLTNFASPGVPSNIDLEGTPGIQVGMLWYKAGSNTQDGQGQAFIYDGSAFTHNGLATYKVDNMANANIAIAGGKVTYGQLVVLGDDTTNRLYMVNRSNTGLVDAGIPPTGYVSASANLLNGLSSSQFVRSDAATTVTAEISSSATMKFSNLTTASKTVGAAWFNATNGSILLDSPATKRIAWNDGGGSLVIRSGSYYSTGERTITTGDGASTLVFNSDGLDGALELKVASAGTADALISYTQSLVLSVSGLTLNGNMLWHAGNMGTGSNLDSDTVDSLHATQFLRSDVDTIFNGNTLNFPDNKRAGFGAANDLLIFHNGLNSYIRHEPYSVGNLNIDNRVGNASMNFTANSYAGLQRTMLVLNGNTQEVVLYAQGVAKANTSANGFNVTGNVRATGNVVALQTVFAGNYVGNASAVFSINAANLFGIVDSAQGVVATSTLNSFVKYTGNTTTAGAFYTNNVDPINTPRLNYGGYFYATKLNGDGAGIVNLTSASLTGTVDAAQGVVATANTNSFIKYTGNTTTAGAFYTNNVDPVGTPRLNYGGYFYATKLYGDGSAVTGVNASTINSLSSAQFVRTDIGSVRTAGTLRANDGVYSTWGVRDDLQIVHQTNNNTTISKAAVSAGPLYIQNLTNTGYMYLVTADSAGTSKLSIRLGGAQPSATLYYNNSEKLQTINGGVSVTGTLNATDGVNAANYIYSPIVSGTQFYSGPNPVWGLRAWGMIDTNGNNLGRNSGIAGINRSGAYSIQVNLSTAMPDIYYCITANFGTPDTSLNPYFHAAVPIISHVTTTSFTISCFDNNGDDWHAFPGRLYFQVIG